MNLPVLTRIGLALLSLLPATVLAVTLGQTRVLSYLGQPLHLEVELVGEDAANLDDNQVSLGSENDFKRLSMSYSHDLSDLSLKPRRQGASWVIDIRSRKPFNQPYIEFPLALRNSGATLVKGITVLLDPPNYQAPVVPERSAAASAVSSSKPAANTPTGQYQVKRGDTLSGIAQRFRPNSLSTYQMTLALYRANPEAFDNGNINRLRAGALLTIPTADRIEAPSDRAARAEIAARGKPARRAPVAAPSALPSATHTKPGTTANAGVEDRLQVLEAEQASEVPPEEELRRQVLLTHEEVEKSRIEQQQMREQVAEMRDELEHLRRLLSLKNEQIATLQSLATARQQQLESITETAAKPSRQQADAAQPTPVATPRQNTVAEAAPNAAPAPAKQSVTPPRVANTTPSTNPTAAKPDLRTQSEWPWWWLLLGLGPIVPIGVWLLRRAPESNALDMALSQHPSVVNAPPKPYSEPTATPEPEPSPPPPPQAAAAPTTQTQPSTRDQPVEPVEPPDLADLEELSIDETFDSLPSMDEFASDTTAPAASSAPQAIELGPLDEELISEADLEELANQLSNEDPDRERDIVSTNDTLSIAPWEQADDTPLEMDIDEPQDDRELVLDMARAYLELGDRDGAINILEDALEKDPGAQRESIEAMLAELRR